MSFFSPPRTEFIDVRVTESTLTSVLRLDPLSIASRGAPFAIRRDGTREFWLKDVARSAQLDPVQLKAQLRRAELKALAAGGAGR